tara:strand:+ start:593 stop:907 length:315 start_codon:yes stop_codon:yes gene_type:complete
MSRVKSIIEKQRASNSGAPFKYYVDERAGDTSQMMSQGIEGAVADGIQAAEDQGVAKGPADKVCDKGYTMNPETKICEKNPDDSSTTSSTLEVSKEDEKNLSGN